MNRESADLLTPRILVVDDERQIHASLRLRIGSEYELAFSFSAREAMERLKKERFDLCIVDIHMPDMDGFAFVEAAQTADPELGYVFLTAFDTDENLRRAIPLRVYDFIGKPLPDRDGFEDRIPGWIERTRRQRRQRELASHAEGMVQDLHTARVERDVELIASENARDALRQTAGLLTTIHAHLLSSVAFLASRTKSDPSLVHLLRSLEEARKTADAAVNVAEGFFDSAYGSRDAAPALIHPGLRDGISIATRLSESDLAGKTVDCAPVSDDLIARGISGIDFLLMIVPALTLALSRAPAASTVRVQCEHVPRLDHAAKDSRYRGDLWINRRNALLSHAGIVISISGAGAPITREFAELWLEGGPTSSEAMPARGLVLGLQKAKGLLGLAIQPTATEFHCLLVLPT